MLPVGNLLEWIKQGRISERDKDKLLARVKKNAIPDVVREPFGDSVEAE